MPPSEKAIIAGIKAAVLAMHTDAPETLTVRNARKKAEEDLGLEAGFLSNEKWKQKSKVAIQDYAATLPAKEESETEVSVTKPKAEKKKPAPKKAEPTKKATKRTSAESKPRPAKRQKKQHTPVEDETSDLTELTPEKSDASSVEGSDKSNAPKKKKKGSNSTAPPKKQSNSKAKIANSDKDDSEDEEPEAEASMADSGSSDAPRKKKKHVLKRNAQAKRQSKSKTTITNSDDSEEEQGSDVSAPPQKKASPKTVASREARKVVVGTDADSEDEKPAPGPVSTPKRGSFKQPPSSDAKHASPKPKVDEGVGSESEMSVVLDPTPKPKRQRAPKGAKKAKEPKTQKVPKTASKDLSPDEIQIKTLQSQLKKCGVNKIWQFELKQYGDDTKAKIRHLTKALKDIGMVGRFSESRAREIKETRELMADVEAVKEMDDKWGMESGRRSRGAAPKKNLREASVEEDAGSGDGRDERSKIKGAGKDNDDEDSDDQPAARKARARASLAFLGDEEDSDD